MALLFPLEIENWEKEQQNHWNYPKIWSSMSPFCVNLALDHWSFGLADAGLHKSINKILCKTIKLKWNFEGNFAQ